jgi:predicted ATPase
VNHFDAHQGQGTSSEIRSGHESSPSDPFASLVRLRSLDRGPHNLPARTTSFIGREKELEAGIDLILCEDTRLVTFTGSGGSGKTRLSIEVARAVIEKFRGGIFFVSLAALTDASAVIFEIASTIGVPDKKEVPLIHSLTDYLKDKRVLMVLDNFEQVISAATIVAELLSACPKLKILATSRSPLRISGEYEFPVLPLPVPNLGERPIVDSLSDNPAIALFVQRAQNVRSDFSLTSKNAETISKICATLDGLPLALELAAACVRIFSPEEMLRLLLERGLDLLAYGARDLPARQRTLRDTIGWSYELLDLDEKKLLLRSSVFVSPFSMKAAERVCNATGDLESKVLDGLLSLTEKSLLQRGEVDGETRFAMLNTIREYAYESLRDTSELFRTMESYLDYCLSFAEEAELQLKGPGQSLWLKRLDSEHDNLRAALRWSIDNHLTDRSLRLVCVLWNFWYIRGYLTEGRSWLTRILADTGSVRSPFRAKALLGAGVLAAWQFDLSVARSLLEESLTISRELGAEEIVALALNYLAAITETEGDYEEANRLLEKSLALFKRLGSKWGIAFTLNGLGVVARDHGEYDKAKSFHEQSLNLFREVGDKRYVARSLANLAVILQSRGEYYRARRLQNESLTLCFELGEKGMIAELLLDLGTVIGRQGNLDMAEAVLAESLSLSKELGNVEATAIGLEELAVCACAKGHSKRAVRLWGAAEALRETRGLQIAASDRDQIKKEVATTRTVLGEQIFGREWAYGRAMTLEQTIEYALGKDRHIRGTDKD